MKILLAGGGSGGSVAPLLAVAEKIKLHHPKCVFLLVGTKQGPEARMAQQAKIQFVAIPTVKWRRYFSWQNAVMPWLFVKSYFSARKILKEFRPDCVFGAGSFVQVPVIFAAKTLGIPCVIHQQDIIPSLSNRLCQLFAEKITVTFSESEKSFASSVGLLYQKHKDKIIVTGNPFREELKEATREEALQFFKLKSDLPVLLVLGGGTGAKYINRLIQNGLSSLGKAVQIIHVSGAGKENSANHENYRQFDFMDIKEMAKAYAAADIVLSRAGLSTITELSALKKVSVIIPMPNSHQEFNGLYLLAKEAAIVLPQRKINLKNFLSLVRKLLFAQEARQEMQNNIFKLMPKNSAERISEIIIKIAEKHYGS